QDIPSHFALRDARLEGLGAIHVDVQFWLVEGLLDSQIRNSCDRGQLLHQRVCEFVVPVDVAPHDLDVDLSGKAEVQDLTDDVRGREVEKYAGKFPYQLQTKIVDVLI